MRAAAYQAEDMRKAAIRALGKRSERTLSMGGAGLSKPAGDPEPAAPDYAPAAAALRADPERASADDVEHDERRLPPDAQPAERAAPAEPPAAAERQ